MSKTQAIAVLLFLFTLGLSIEICTQEYTYTGCTRASEYGCDGTISNSYCEKDETAHTKTCTSTCDATTNEYCSVTACSAGEYTPGQYYSKSMCGIYVQAISYTVESSWLSTALDTAPEVCEDICVYGWADDYAFSYDCTKSVGVGFLSLCTETTMFVSCECVRPSCIESTSSYTVTCSVDGVLGDKTCSEYEEGGCSQTGTFCDEGSVKECDDTTKNAKVLLPCFESGLECVETSSTTATCVNPSERETSLTCSPNGDKRCNPTEPNKIQICTNGQWQAYGVECQLGCNASGVDTDQYQCNDYTTATGFCTFGDKACIDAGEDAFQFLCAGGDWTLTKECPTGRCNNESTECWYGCNFLSNMCYAENYSCYYCNELGTWYYSGKCLGEVNNITQTCSLNDTCTTGAYTCSNNWVITCSSGEWVRVEECVYGCARGSCITSTGDIFEPFMELSETLLLFIPSLGDFAAIIAAVGFLGYFLRAIARKSGDLARGKP